MKVIPIESVININNPSISWAEISPTYNGYQISNTGLIRSMKFYKKYPYGILISPDKNGKVKLSNSLNQVEQVDIKDIIANIRYFNIPTYYTDPNSRNPLITSQSNVIKKKIEYQKELKTELQKPSGFHFKTID